MKTRFSILSLLVVFGILLAACQPAATPAPTTAPVAPTSKPVAAPTTAPVAAPTTAPAPAATVDIGGVQYSTAYSGKTVTIFGVAADEQARLFQKEFDEFTAKTGIKVQYEGNKDFETQVLVRVEGGNAPDLAQFAQPALLNSFVKKGKVVDLNKIFEPGFLAKHYSQGFLDAATLGGIMAGAWHNSDVKSLVWYPKAAFDAKGYKVPQTWDDLLKLSDQIVADGSKPWCIGIESAGATGWVGTDWVEDVMLRTTTPENYDKWTRGELKFSSPEVKNAFEIVGKIWFNPKYVFGGTPFILTTSFGDATKGLFDNPPKCYLHRQASFIKNFFPKTATYGKEYSYFYLPPIDPKFGNPVLGSGSITGMFNDRPEVREVMKFLSTGYSMKEEALAGVALAPQLDADPSWYPDEGTRGFAKIIQSATTFRFDGSDLMPSAVGAGTFWKGIVDWVGGADLDSVLKTIDDSWPK